MKDNFSQEIKKELPGIKRNISLGRYTSFKIGGRARYFFVAKNQDDLISVIKKVKKIKLPFFILGGGSNLLISDRAYRGLIIKMENKKYKIKNNKIYAEAGLSLSLLVKRAEKNNLTGLEWLVGIPGTIGGAIFGNAGAFGKSMKDIIKKVEIFNTKNQKVKFFKNKECKFAYRESIFKRNKNLIILSAEIQLKKGEQKEIKKEIKKNLTYKKKTQPLEFPSAGSIFKNFILNRKKTEKVKKNKIISAALMIENCGLKGKKIGKAKISEKHANFIVNLGGAKAKDVVKLINLTKEKVKNKFKIDLEEEICYFN